MRDNIGDSVASESPFSSTTVLSSRSSDIDGSSVLSSSSSSSSVDGVFGSLQWSNNSLFEGLGMGSKQRRLHHQGVHIQRPATSRRQLLAHASGRWTGSEAAIDLTTTDASTGLVAGFHPFRDSYLVHSLSRLNDLIYKMFPDVDGYIGE